jgi:ketosteroid isomerase-like protein
MSEENVEIVRRMLEASDRRDSEAVFATYDPDIEFDMSKLRPAIGSEDVIPDLPEHVRGRDALRAALHEWVSAWEIVDYEHEELIDAGDQVVHFIQQRIRGRTSGIEFTFRPYAQVWTLRAGKITAMKAYADRAEALEAAGLSE